MTLPVIDVSSLGSNSDDERNVAAKIGDACRDTGFFYISNHGIDVHLQEKLESLSRAFFALPLDEKMKIRMELGGRAWRGYFPLGDELTSGRPDLKEGLYFGEELGEVHPLVKAKTAMHGANLFPQIADFKETVLQYLKEMEQLGHRLMRGVSLSLGLEPEYFYRSCTKEPLQLFRIFHYPHVPRATVGSDWGVGAHTDYGLLTILRQDDVGGLQVMQQGEWTDAPPIANTFVVNIGDMLDRVTGGLYRSTLHRVAPPSRDRISFPYFFDPNFFAEVQPIRAVFDDDATARWDQQSVHEFRGRYGDYLLAKVAKVFPQLVDATK